MHRLITFAAIMFLPTATFAQSFTVSEEDPPRTCPRGSIVTSFNCTGDFCDNISIICTRLDDFAVGHQHWTRWVESGGESLAFCAEIDPEIDLSPPVDGFMSGIACRGGNCDDISMHCTRFTGVMIDEPRCTTSRHSDENRALGIPPGFAIAAIRCSGRHCDNKDITFCPIVPR